MPVRSIVLLLLSCSVIAACQLESAAGPLPSRPTLVAPPPGSPAALRASAPPSATPTVTPKPQQERAMYQAAINAFFADSQVQRLLQPDLLVRELVYIGPTFFDTHRPVSNEIMQMLRAHTSAAGLVEAQHEQPGGLLLAVGSIGQDPSAATVYPQSGPTIQLSAQISGTSCGASVGIGYLLVETDHGWQAQQYLVAVC